MANAPFDFSVYLFDSYTQIADLWLAALLKFRNSTGEALYDLFTSLPLPANLLKFQARLLLSVETLIDDVLASVSISIIRAALAQFPYPKEFGWSVLTKESAVKQVVDWIAQASVTMTTPNGLYSVILIDYLNRRLELLKLFRGVPKVEFVFKKIIGKFVAILVRLASVLFQVFATLIMLALIIELAKLVLKGEWPETLQQETARKRIQTSAGPIVRRLPGGSKP